MFLGNVVTNRINFDKIEWTARRPMAIEQPDFLVEQGPVVPPGGHQARAGRGAVRVRLLQQDHRPLRGALNHPRPRQGRAAASGGSSGPARTARSRHPKRVGDLTAMKRGGPGQAARRTRTSWSGCMATHQPASTGRTRTSQKKLQPASEGEAEAGTRHTSCGWTRAEPIDRRRSGTARTLAQRVDENPLVDRPRVPRSRPPRPSGTASPRG